MRTTDPHRLPIGLDAPAEQVIGPLEPETFVRVQSSAYRERAHILSRFPLAALDAESVGRLTVAGALTAMITDGLTEPAHLDHGRRVLTAWSRGVERRRGDRGSPRRPPGPEDGARILLAALLHALREEKAARGVAP